MEQAWWKETVVYQIYPRSFMDADGDGVGDIPGIISKLDYLQELGIGVIWVCPVYASPNDDNGYDISDYQAIMPEFGTMQDFDRLLGEVHQRGMRLIMDLVINHTSDEHPWFVESRSSKESEYRDYYIWRQPENGQEPNNWGSIFEGSAWEWDEHTKEYFLHIFSRKQPDLNWENPDVRRDLYDMVNWWLDKGIDGFRIDAISHIKKKPGLPDVPNPNNEDYPPSFEGHLNQPGIQTYLEELKKETFDHYDIMTVGEANGVTIEEADAWVGETNGKFNMIFQFDHVDLWGKGIDSRPDIFALKEIFAKWQKGLDGVGWNALFLENHDLPRSISTWGDADNYWYETATGLATMYFFMQGTPFIYQGQEIGMTNVEFPSIEDYNDIAIRNLYHKERQAGMPHEDIMKTIWKTGRDNSRTPMQWDSSPGAGFTTGTPWLKVNPNYSTINVEQEKKRSPSVFTYYQTLIRLRQKWKTLVYGSFDLALPDHPQIMAYIRTLEDTKMLIMVNLYDTKTSCELPGEFAAQAPDLILNNYGEAWTKGTKEIMLRPFEAVVYALGGGDA
ncbi:glycoside hydrolase family 13 protein [Marinococcus luteus]|uniref:glycoside hydrolase family 13 protein n=1 Tax=Marinococcus luteus TaxID=1122204 RepID=UPI002ACC8DFA|nr:alpha-glucosidase [Marinococcus luteus]MDZ5783327.1 alpha-glucosidase [Marinococcus luteus]